MLGDGGYLLELEKRGWVRAGPFTPEVALTRPEALKELHIEFREAGAEVLQALTFYASRDKLATVGLQDRLPDLNRAAVRIAREVAGDRCLVAGNISLTWMYEPDSPKAADRVRQTFDEQLAVQSEEGIDFVIGETFSFLGEALLAVECAKKTRLPVMVTVCFENKPVTTDGKTAAECAKALADAGRRHRGHQLPARPRADPAPHGGDAEGGPRLPSPASPWAIARPAEQPDFTSLPAFPYELDPSSSPAGRWPTTRSAPGTSASTTSARAAVRWPSTSGRWPRRSGKRPAEDRPWRVDYSQPMSAYEYYGHEKAGS